MLVNKLRDGPPPTRCAGKTALGMRAAAGCKPILMLLGATAGTALPGSASGRHLAASLPRRAANCARRRSLRAMSAASGLQALEGGEAEAMARISAARVSCKTFLDKPVDKSVMQSVLHMTQRAPTSFNTQPYRLVVVSSKEVRLRRPP